MAEVREGVVCIVAVLENRAREVGLAALNLEAPVLALSQSAESASFTNTLTLLQQHAPDVILTCASAAISSQLLPLLTKLFGSARFVALPRSCFDDTRGRSTVRLVATAADKDVARAGKALYLAFAAADACVRFCGDELQLLTLPDSLHVHHELSGRTVFIDGATVEHLELIRGGAGVLGGSGGLLGAFKTATKGGAQLLKASLLQPLRDVATIDARLDALDEILHDETLFISLKSLLSKVPKARYTVCFNREYIADADLLPSSGLVTDDSAGACFDTLVHINLRRLTCCFSFRCRRNARRAARRRRYRPVRAAHLPEAYCSETTRQRSRHCSTCGARWLSSRRCVPHCLWRNLRFWLASVTSYAPCQCCTGWQLASSNCSMKRCALVKLHSSRSRSKCSPFALASTDFWT